MPDARLLVDKYVDLDVLTKQGIQQTGAAAGFQDYAGTPMHVQVSPGTQHQCKWLPWHPGMISTTVLDRDVLTGPMSGCLIAVYTDPLGRRKVAHIGTTGEAERSDAVKAAWRRFAIEIIRQTLSGFNPAAMSGVPQPQSNANKFEQTEVWGMVTTEQRFFALRVSRQMGSTRYRIVRVEEMQSLGDAVVRNWKV
jgi:hypothetical protein